MERGRKRGMHASETVRNPRSGCKGSSSLTVTLYAKGTNGKIANGRTTRLLLGLEIEREIETTQRSGKRHEKGRRKVPTISVYPAPRI